MDRVCSQALSYWRCTSLNFLLYTIVAHLMSISIKHKDLCHNRAYCFKDVILSFGNFFFIPVLLNPREFDCQIYYCRYISISACCTDVAYTWQGYMLCYHPFGYNISAPISNLHQSIPWGEDTSRTESAMWSWTIQRMELHLQGEAESRLTFVAEPYVESVQIVVQFHHTVKTFHTANTLS